MKNSEAALFIESSHRLKKKLDHTLHPQPPLVIDYAVLLSQQSKLSRNSMILVLQWSF